MAKNSNNTSSIEYFRKQYAIERKIESIVNARILKRPNVKKWQVAISFAALPFFLSVAIVLPLLFIENIAVKITVLFLCVFLVIEMYLRFCCILTVKCYQATAKKETRKRCSCIPSCSEYAVLSLKTIFPLLLALLKIRKRLFITCNGDYVIDFPTKKMEKEFEKNL